MNQPLIKKGIIFCGAAASGKTKLAVEILDSYGEDEKVFIPVRNNKLDSPFLYSDCTKRTKVILFDDVLNLKQLDRILIHPEQILVNRKFEIPFSIPTPRILITLDENIEVGNNILNSASCKARYDIVVVNP